MVWQRSQEGYPRIWADFTCEKTKQRFIIKDLSKEYYDIALGYLTNIFLTDSAICKVTGRSEDPISRVQLQQKWLKVMKSNMATICCTDDELPRVAAINMTTVKTKELPQTMKNSSTLTKYDEFIQAAEDLIALEGDFFTGYGADHYLHAVALLVLPEFRGQGIATQLLKSRITMCKALGLNGTASVFVTRGGQAAARSAGYQDLGSRVCNGHRIVLMGTTVFD